MVSSTIACLLVVAVIFLILIVYSAVLFWSYQKSRFIFAPATYSPPPDENPFYPTGDIIELTPQQIEDRAEFITRNFRN